jgi:two-component system chemotaxis response regulator CheY
MPQTSRAEPLGLERLRVLVVDDEEPMRALLARMLSRLKVGDVVEVESGAQGLERIAAEKFDLVLLDWNMPEMSGLEFFDRVHAVEPALPFVMVTGRSDARSIVAAKNSGVTAYVVKPVTPGELRAKLRYALSTRG